MLVAADAGAGRARRGLHEGPHALDQPPFGVERLEVDRPAGRHLEVGRAVLLDGHDAQEVLDAEGQRSADQKRLVVRIRPIPAWR